MARVCRDHGDGFSSCQFDSRFSMNSYLLTIHQQLLACWNSDWVIRDHSPLDRRSLHLAGGNPEGHFISSSNRSCSRTNSRSRLDFSYRRIHPARYSEALSNDSDGIFGCLECYFPQEPNSLIQAR